MELLRRGLVTLLVALIALVLAAATGWLVYQASAGVARPRVAERVRAVETGAVAIGRWLDDVAAAATSEALDGPGWAYAVDPGGTVVQTSPAAAALAGLQRGPPSPGVSVAVDPFERVPTVQAAAPGAAHIVVVGVPLDALVDLLSRVPEPEGGRLRLVDPAGRVLAPGAGPTALGRVGPNLSEPVRRAAAGPGFAEYRGEAGIEMSAAYAPVGHGWALVLLQEAAAFAPAGEALRALGAAVPGLAGFVMLVTVGFVTLDMRARRYRRDSERTKQAFLAVAGHELRTPLTVIAGMLAVLAREGDMADSARVKAARTAARQTKQLERLIERLLFVAHLESEVGVGVSPAPTDLAPMLQRTVDTQRGLAPLHEVTLETEEPLWALADTRAVEQTLLHLLDNAVRYSPAGSTVRVGARHVRRRVEISVEDDGVGLPADTERIFELFVQGETVDDRLLDEGGVGLGLAIVRTLVTAMGGKVRAEHRDPGARFVVDLPAAPGRD